ncbi:MAG TPA: serine hydrolase domain-containing protein [Flavisolibacter sp.]|nr:serine hydrolase domain-containing protein [Flavisolibacter sp.]
MRYLFIALLQTCFFITHAQHQKFIYNAKPSAAGIDERRLQRLDSFINQNIKEGRIPNTATFIARNGKVVHHKAYGWRNIENGERLDQKSIFRNASQTKAITSVAAMILFERGYFHLNDPLSKYLPEFKDMQVLDTVYSKDSTYKAHPATKQITIKHLLAHTSGIMYGHPISDKSGIPILHSLKGVTLKEVIPQVAKFPLLHEPGLKFSYGLNTDVLGYLVEKLSGKPLDVFFRDEIFKPLGMNDTYFYLPEEKKSRLVELYQSEGKDNLLRVSSNETFRHYSTGGASAYFSGGAGLVGTIEDYAKFCQMLLNEGSFNNVQLLSRKTVQTMLSNQIGENTVWESENKFGLGFELVTEKGISSLLGTVGSFRWGGLYSTDYTIDPKEKLIILFYTNIFPNAHWNLNNLYRNIVYQALK